MILGKRFLPSARWLWPLSGLAWLGLAVCLSLGLALLGPGELPTTLRTAAEAALWRAGSPLLPGYGLSLYLSLVVVLGALAVWLPFVSLAAQPRWRPWSARLLAACERVGVRWGGLPLLLVGVVGLGRAGVLLGAQRGLFPFAAAHGAREEGFWALALVYLATLLPLTGLTLGAALGHSWRHLPVAPGRAVVSDFAPALLVATLLTFGAATLAQLASCQPQLCATDHMPALLVDVYRTTDVPLSPIFGQTLALLLAPPAALALIAGGWCYSADEGWKQQVARAAARQGLRLLRALLWLLRH
jgi:hypothetical protein